MHSSMTLLSALTGMEAKGLGEALERLQTTRVTEGNEQRLIVYDIFARTSI